MLEIGFGFVPGVLRDAEDAPTLIDAVQLLRTVEKLPEHNFLKSRAEVVKFGHQPGVTLCL